MGRIFPKFIPAQVLLPDSFHDVGHPVLDRVINYGEVLASVKAGKAAGLDGLSFDFIKSLPQNWLLYLTSLFNRIMSQEKTPIQWSQIVMTMLHKKGDMLDANTYRGLALLNMCLKCFTSILNRRLVVWTDAEGILPDNQAGFHAGRSCLDLKFFLSAIIQIHLRLPGQCVYAVFVDFKREFDSIQHPLLWYKLFSLGVSGQIIRDTFDNLTEGVLQGEILSPLLFALFLADVEDYFRANNCSGLDVNGRRDTLLLLYADDMVILGDSIADINRKLEVLESYCSLNKLVVNTAKTKLVCFRKAGGLKKLVLKAFYEGREIEQVKSYSYLGIPFSSSTVFANAEDLSRAKAASAGLPQSW
ncbi:Reverse transcriptase (RNA-dependent DNA polymerase) [Nesidiocoris tenuis]|uniref:Reverse transcriptase (RNA-dependent DNA polymerase) n=1 Tax=Nesidiocoris tenuis TaxID=355587 RepID=A0ABN7AFU8_9HEMI|nr:Reverse transcriptase (RNA-dependent DNA polymerase) [Nesidiocoris tenuis]